MVPLEERSKVTLITASVEMLLDQQNESDRTNSPFGDSSPGARLMENKRNKTTLVYQKHVSVCSALTHSTVERIVGVIECWLQISSNKYASVQMKSEIK